MAKKNFMGTNAVNKFISTRMDEEDVQDTPDTIDVPNTQKKNVKTRQQKHPRINMAFYTENHEYLEYITRLRGVSITQYVNDLIAKDAEMNKETIEKLKALMNE